jgi:hypothetical protein
VLVDIGNATVQTLLAKLILLLEQQWDHIKERENRLKTKTAAATQAILDSMA